jgi:hypothetical protein
MKRDIIQAPFSRKQVENINTFQTLGNFHPFTCLHDGDEMHIAYEFEKKFPHLIYKKDFEMYCKEQKARGVNYPDMEFTQTEMVADQFGLKCPCCGWTQNWVHGFMAQNHLVNLK